MKSFQEYLLEVKRVFRADPRQIRPGKKARRYDFDPFGNSAPAGSLPSEEMTRQRGLFAAPKDEMVPYLAGRDISFAYVQPTRTKNKRGFQRGTVYYSDANREKVQSRRPVVTGYSTKKQGFKKIGSGEYFRPGQRVPRPTSREEIQDPIAYMQKYVNVKFVPDLGKVATTLHRNSKSGKYSLTINSVQENL
jgi:hypothetical protein